MAESRRTSLSWTSLLHASLLGGLAIGAWRALVNAIIDTGDSVTGAAVSGFAIGAVMGPIIAWSARRESVALGPLDRGQAKLARRAARRGAVPADPEIRQAAYRLAVSQRDYVRKLRVPFLILVVPTIALLLVLTVTTSTKAALVVLPTVAVLFGIGLAVFWFWLPGHWQHRADLLRDPAEPSLGRAS
jgi:hypothetical protein